jgi:hypothetical protein
MTGRAFWLAMLAMAAWLAASTARSQTATAGVGATAGAAQAAPVACESLASVSLPRATITTAQEVPAGEYTPPGGGRQANLPAFCRIALTVSPQIPKTTTAW